MALRSIWTGRPMKEILDNTRLEADKILDEMDNHQQQMQRSSETL